MTNEVLKTNLLTRRETCISTIRAIPELDAYLKAIYKTLNRFDFNAYKQKIEKEILENLKEWWTNPDKGINKDEELYAILFEYDYFFQKNVKAVAYGIGAYENYQIQTDKFDMGYDYDFTTAFYSSPGISLNFFDSLEALDYDNLPEKFKDTTIDFDELKIGEPIEVDGLNDIEDLLGYQEIIELHKLQGMLAIHEVLVKLDIEKEFESLNYKDNFMFLIDEHDSGEVYPLLIKKK